MQTKFLLPKMEISHWITALMLIMCTVFLLSTIGALNGGLDLTASVWDALRIWLQGMLTSTWLLVLTLITLVVCVWRLAHGQGYGMLSVILGILAVALIGPGFVTAAAKATGEIASISTLPLPIK